MSDRKRILVVEDDKDISRALTVRLRAAGYDVVTAFDGLMGMSTAVKHRPDLAILDVMMPAGGGLDLAERLQNLASTAGTPFIVLTASKRAGLRERAMALGALAFLEKPYDPEALLAEVRRGLGDPAPATA